MIFEIRDMACSTSQDAQPRVTALFRKDDHMGLGLRNFVLGNRP
jgi:hypothetical protein